MAFKKLIYPGAPLLALIVLLTLASCRPVDYSRIPTYSGQHRLRAVIEIPAGSVLDIVYNTQSHRFNVHSSDTARDPRQHLPLPVNFGFIPSTYYSDEDGTASRMIDIMVIGENRKYITTDRFIHTSQ